MFTALGFGGGYRLLCQVLPAMRLKVILCAQCNACCGPVKKSQMCGSTYNSGTASFIAESLISDCAAALLSEERAVVFVANEPARIILFLLMQMH
jgi:hypothetical protein